MASSVEPKTGAHFASFNFTNKLICAVTSNYLMHAIAARSGAQHDPAAGFD